jgi:hypothetical protein
MATCPEAAAEKLAFETALHLTLPPLPTDHEERIQDRQEQANQWRRVCKKCKSYVSPLVLDWDLPRAQ